jgi:hypothetical protein
LTITDVSGKAVTGAQVTHSRSPAGATAST